MKPWLSKAAAQFRNQVDDCYPDRNTKSDGWLASLAHLSRAPKSDHNPDPKTGCVRAIDITARLSDDKRIPEYLALLILYSDLIRQQLSQTSRT